jgi:hypothetical protein
MDVSGQLYTPAALPQEKSPCYPLLGGPQSRSGRRGEEKKFPAPTGARTLDHPARSPGLVI